MKLRVNDIVVDPGGRVWFVSEIDYSRQNEIKCVNGGSYCYWPEACLLPILSIDDALRG